MDAPKTHCQAINKHDHSEHPTIIPFAATEKFEINLKGVDALPATNYFWFRSRRTFFSMDL